ncbi:MAG TPA: chromate efflux transporter [Thermoanaerobaculia bacterium]|nr:chromate efflux transporter [Thermoanaerobaculia bacterium]
MNALAQPTAVIRAPWREALGVWCRVAALSFGGPAGQIGVMQRLLVEEKRWVSQERFLHALNFCMLLPGPEAQQLAIYLGWLLHGNAMGIVAGTLFVLPGFASILALSFAYVTWQGTGVVAAIFYGLKPAVLAVVLAALVRLGRRALDGSAKRALAAFAFVAIFFLALPYPLVVAAAAAGGWWLGRLGIGGFGRRAGDGATLDDENHQLSAAALRAPTWRRALRVAGCWVPLWWAPVLLLWAALGARHVLVREGVFFGETAMVTFGGAYAVLAYVAQRASAGFGWLSPREMLDGLGMAETTPGPLIQVVQFVGFIAAWRHPGPLAPPVAALLGSLVTAWMTFVPSFLWIFLGAPSMERLRGRRGLTDALAAITAAVVGVILQLAVWFALHTLFGGVREIPLVAGPWVVGRLWAPALATLDPWALGIAAGACWLLFRTRAGMLATLGAAVAAGALVQGARFLF